MSSYIPITLVGNNLGKRHQYLNGLVNNAFQNKVPFSTIQDKPEASPIDKIFKIDLASKYRNVEYIMETLKDDDMLYVSRAFKCYWLLESEYSHILNPAHLEEVLYPEMILPAANKMMHWIQLHLKDSKRCEEFYDYYILNNKLTMAVKFLTHCSKKFILEKTTADTLGKLNPKYLAIIFEKCPEVALNYFKHIENNETISINFENNNSKIYNNMKKTLKIDANVYLDLLETYCESGSMKPFGYATTKYIMKNHKERFLNKPELYTAWFLDMNMLGKCLNKEEIKDVLLKLARAEYLSHWFSYKTVEPLIKCLPPQERTLLKNQIFVDKSFGAVVKEWPYKPPTRPINKTDKKNFLFMDDYISSIRVDDHLDVKCMPRCCLMSNKCLGAPGKIKTYLDELFDTYRFHNFEHTIFELRNKITKESSSQNRQYMMLVLVSKTGGCSTHLEVLLQFLSERFTNEPANLRAAVVRSLVRRAFVWRASESTWQLLLQFSHDLGLDGKTPAAACDEGLHAVVLRNFLANTECNSDITKAYLKNYSTFSDYSLNNSEKQSVQKYLPTLILQAAVSDLDNALEYFNILLDTLIEYHLRVTDCEGAIGAISDFISRDCKKASSLLERLFSKRINRKEFFKENFTVIQTDESYLNVLRHDANLLKGAENFKVLIEKNQLNHEGFFRKLALYFGEDDGLASHFFNVIKSKIGDMNQSNNYAQFSRAFVLLATDATTVIQLRSLNDASPKSTEKRLEAAILSNVHLSRPLIDLDVIGWPKAGAKAITNKLITCRPNDLENNINRTMQWRRTASLSLNLALRKENFAPVLASISTTRPSVAVKAALRYFTLKGNDLDLQIWDIIRPTIEKLDLTSDSRRRLRVRLSKIMSMPPMIQANYFVTVYKILSEKNTYFSSNIMKKLLPKLPEEFVINICTNFLNTFDIREYIESPDEFRYNRQWSNYIAIIGNFLLLNTNEDIRKRKLETLGEKFFKTVEQFWETSPVITALILKEFVGALTCSTLFVNLQYVDALPVYQKIITWLQKLLPMEEYFNVYVDVHATMLLYKSFRQSHKQAPNIFAEKTIKWGSVSEMVGAFLGKYLSHEIQVLKNQYFATVRDLYQLEMLRYLGSVLSYHGENKRKFTTAFIKSFVQASENYEIVSPYIVSDSQDFIKDALISTNIKCHNPEHAFFIAAHTIYISY